MVFSKYNEDFNLREDEILKDGIIHCLKCDRPRQFISEDGTFKTRCFCPCQMEARVKEEEARELEQHKHEIKVLKQNSLLGERYINSTFESLDTNRPRSFLKAARICKEYCNKWQELNRKGLGLYIYGNVGTGKTELTACICNELTSQLVPVLITNFYEIMKKIRAAGYENEGSVIDSLADIKLLILDDIGTESLTRTDGHESFIQDKIYDIINWRYNKKKPTLFTSNYSIKELIEKRGLKRSIGDRISSMSAAVINIDGESYRMNEIK